MCPARTPRALVLTSTSQRHRYFVSQIASRFELAGVMAEPKRNYFTESRASSPLVENHFAQLAAAEARYFSDAKTDIDIHTAHDLNTPESIAHALSLKPDIVCLFGTSILREPWLEAFDGRIVNLHLGLSPFYRGSATLFWPFYFDELACLGTTIHLAVRKVDAGAILKRVKAQLQPGDSYYDATTRLIRDSMHVFPQTVMEYLQGARAPFEQEKTEGRLLKKSDFNEAALQRVLDYVGSGLSEERINHAKVSTLCPCSP